MQNISYRLTPEQISSVTDVEFAFSTDRLLPEWDSIPVEFKAGNIYTGLAESLFFGTQMPIYGVVLNVGVDAEALNKCIRAHLKSFSSQHEHKIAGVGLMIACACVLHPLDN